jgi:hypothetical protein
MNLRELEAVRASLVASLAAVEVAIARASESSAPADAPITLDDAVRLFGSKRKARAFFASAERAGFKVVRIGHACSMDRAEWARALEALGTKPSRAEPRPAKHPDESPAALLSSAGLAQPRGRKAA